MAYSGSVITALKLAPQLEQRFGSLEADLDLPSVTIDTDDLLIAERAIRAEKKDALAALVAVAHEDDVQRNALVTRVDLERAVAFPRIPRRHLMHQAAQMAEPAVEPVLLLSVLGHADDVEPEIQDLPDERLRREPGIHQQILRTDVRRQCAFHEAESGLRLVQHAFHARLVAHGTMIDSFVRSLAAVLLVWRCEQVERDGDEAEGIRPSERQQIVPADAVSDGMVEDSCQEFDRLAAVARDDGIVQHERMDTPFPCQFRDDGNDACREKQEKLAPVEGRVVHEAIKRVLAGTSLLGMSGCQVAEQIHVAEGQQQKEFERFIDRHAAAFADICPTKQFRDLQFFHGTEKFCGSICNGVILL